MQLNRLHFKYNHFKQDKFKSYLNPVQQLLNRLFMQTTQDKHMMTSLDTIEDQAFNTPCKRTQLIHGHQLIRSPALIIISHSQIFSSLFPINRL